VDARSLFRTDTGDLRAAWRIVVFFAATVAATVVASTLIGPALGALFAAVDLRGADTAPWVEVAGLLGGTAIALRLIDQRPWRDVWLDRGAARPTLLGAGFALGALAIGLPLALLVAVHWLRETTGPAGSWLGAATRVSLVLVPAALAEELLTRGYLLSVLREAWGWAWSLAATSIGFGLLHLENNGANLRPVLLVTLAGFFLGAVVWATRSLYAAWLTHFAWNWTMAVLFHTAVSGYPLEAPRYRYVDAGPSWATGGNWGPEGGLPAGLGMIGGIAFLVVRRARKRRDDTAATT
jgi:hypothetical protein